jgi:hypothetical protein
MNRTKLITTLLIAWSLPSFVGFAADALPFDRTAINRYSLDGLPRSISVRQGADVWIGYDLERATPCKVWRAPEGKSGLNGAFTTRSVGKALFEDKSDVGWALLKAEKDSKLKVRYLGCTQGKGHFELRWELKQGARSIRLKERISTTADTKVAAWRELKAEGLQENESLLLPAAVGTAWRTVGGRSMKAIAGEQWIRIVIP